MSMYRKLLGEALGTGLIDITYLIHPTKRIYVLPGFLTTEAKIDHQFGLYFVTIDMPQKPIDISICSRGSCEPLK